MRSAPPTRAAAPRSPRAALALPPLLLLWLACAAAGQGAAPDGMPDEMPDGVPAAAPSAAPSRGAAPPDELPVAERDAPFELARLMADPEWIGRSPEDPWWAPDGEAVYFWRRVAGTRAERELVALELESGLERVLDDSERALAGAPGGEWDRDRRRLVFARQGDLFVRELDQPLARQLTRTRARASDPFWLDERRIAFLRDDTWLARDLGSGLEEELAPLLVQDDPEEAEAKRERGFLERQQERLFEVVRRRAADAERGRSRARELEQADPARAPRPWYLGKGRRIVEQRLAPGGGALAVRLADERGRRAERDTMAEWITASGLATSRDVRPAVGSEPRQGEALVVLDLDARERIDVDLSMLPAAALFPRLDWSPDGARLAVLARSLDRRERWIFVLEERGRELTLIHHLRDPAWINGRFDRLGWLPDGSALWFLSEESGWSQLRVWDTDGRAVRALTSGEQEVDQVRAAPGGRWLLYRSNLGHPGVQEVWRVDPRGGEPERLTDHGGRLDFWPAPDGERLLLRASRLLELPELYVQDARPLAAPRKLTSSMSPEFAELPWVEPRLVPVPARHGRPVWSRLFLPPAEHMLPPGERPAVLFVHGAGYLQSAHAGWPRYLRETLFHTLLARRGVVVLDMDYRASSGYGRDWRTAIHLATGDPELDDLEDGVRWLVREHGVDPARVGVYGGSYGGFLVLQALFTRPALFACGAALRPVTDWAHYNHGYTANLLGLPDEHPDAYARSSPIEHAGGLSAPLLICHGLVDDNVLAKDSVRLAQRLIELGKDDWELALYPVEPHGFREPSSWLDQYRRILRLFERHLSLR